MKIAILSFYSGHTERGVEVWTRELAGRLSKKHSISVFQTGQILSNTSYNTRQISVKTDFDKSDSRGTWLRKMFIDYWSLKIAIFSIKIIPAIWKGNYDVIIPTDGGWEPAFIRLITWLRNKKMVIVGHSGIGWDDLNNLYSFPDVFISLSEEAKKWANSRNPLVKSIMVPNGVDIVNFSPKGEKAKIHLKPPIVLSVGALEEGKRHKYIIDAVKKIDASLIILGKGNLENELSLYGKKELGDRFMLSSVDHSDIPKFYRTCNIFTSASGSWYSFEMVILEAMASGKGVVVNNDEIRKSIVGDAGILVDSQNTGKYSEALEKALKLNWGHKPRKQAEKYSWDLMAKEYEKLFLNLIN